MLNTSTLSASFPKMLATGFSSKFHIQFYSKNLHTPPYIIISVLFQCCVACWVQNQNPPKCWKRKRTTTVRDTYTAVRRVWYCTHPKITRTTRGRSQNMRLCCINPVQNLCYMLLGVCVPPSPPPFTFLLLWVFLL